MLATKNWEIQLSIASIVRGLDNVFRPPKIIFLTVLIEILIAGVLNHRDFKVVARTWDERGLQSNAPWMP